MFCRSCATQLNDKAVACTNCGMAPMAGDAHCQECGAGTKPQQVMCTGCGCKLKSNSPIPVGNVQNCTGMTTGSAILWLVCCWPIGFVKLNQGLKSLAWMGIGLITGGFGFLAMIVDYFMCNMKANKTGTLGEWEFFPRE